MLEVVSYYAARDRHGFIGSVDCVVSVLCIMPAGINISYLNMTLDSSSAVTNSDPRTVSSLVDLNPTVLLIFFFLEPLSSI